MDCYIGIDLGTSSVKTAAIDKEGNIINICGESYPILHPFTDASEQNPESWWAATTTSIINLVESLGAYARNIRAISFSGQMHGLVLLDNTGRVLRNAIIWPDRRSASICAEWTSAGFARELSSVTGLPLATGFLAPSLEWVKRNEPEIYAQARWALLPKDYLRYRFIGTINSEPTDGTGTYLFDIAERKWSDKTIEQLGFRRELFPDLIEPLSDAGTLLPKIAQQLRLPADVHVIAGGSDQATAALALDIKEEGTIGAAISTGGTITTLVHKPIKDPRLHTFCHLTKNTWLTMGATLAAGASFSWFQQIVSEGKLLKLEELSKMAESVPLGSNGIIFLPYLNGDRTPHMNPHARGSFIGLNLSHTTADLARSVMEGVVYSMYLSFELFAEHKIPVKQVIAYAGGSKSPLWRQILADVSGKPVSWYSSPDVSSIGAAKAAALGTGVKIRELQAETKKLDITEPDSKRHDEYKKRIELYKRLYTQLVGIFDDISNL